MKNPGSNGFLKTFGPGLLYAGAAVGVSHLVQSTSAGAKFGWVMVVAVILANVLKFPFFEFGPRYATATGNSLLSGYKSLGGWALALFLILTLLTMFAIQAAVTVVTAGLVKYSLGLDSTPDWLVSAIILGICLIVLGVGRYKVLDALMKFIIVLLSLTTLFAILFALFADVEQDPQRMTVFTFSDAAHVGFLIALLGWMPAPIDISIWHSVWTLARKKDTGHVPTLKQSRLDFNIGYWGTTFLALCFLGLGALMLYGTDVELAGSGKDFAKQVVDMYANSLGNWARPIIAVAALTTMFSTTLTCLDAFPRVLRTTVQLFAPQLETKKADNYLYWGWIIFVAAGAIMVLGLFVENMGDMVKFATILSFLTAPILALLNMLVVYGPTMPKSARPGKGMLALSITGLVFLVGFGIYYLWVTFLQGLIA